LQRSNSHFSPYRGVAAELQRRAVYIGDDNRQGKNPGEGVGVGAQDVEAPLVTMPLVAAPSPHVILAVKSPSGALGLLSVNVATRRLNCCWGTAVIGTAAPFKCASATMALELAVAVEPPPTLMIFTRTA
jgi:hypothetical protein